MTTDQRGDFDSLNDAIFRLNASRRVADRKREEGDLTAAKEYEGRADHWHTRAAIHAERLGTELTTLDNDTITAALFLKLATD